MASKSKRNTLASLRSIGKSINCVAENKKVSVSSKGNGLMNITHLDVVEADKIAEKIVESDDFHSAFFLAPINSRNLFINDDDDGEQYWSEYKPILIKRITNLMNLKYGIDFAILRRGIFSLLAFFIKDEDGDYIMPKNILDMIVPDAPDVFMRTIDYYFKNTDSEFFPINAITATDKDSDNSKCSISESTNVSIEGVQVDISFLRSDSFKSYDSDEEREHFTYHIFVDGLIHSLALEHRIISFDDEEVDKLIGKISENVCFRKNGNG